MKQLSINWITEGLLDFEYKKYLLLAYLKQAKESFNQQALYPILSDLILHYNNLITLNEQKKLITNSFPKKISKVDLKNFQVEYEKLIEEDKTLQEIEQIVNYALPRIKNQLEVGKEIYEIVESKSTMEPVGLIPLNKDDGYIFIRSGKQKDTRVYNYQVTIIEAANEKHRGIKTNYVTTYTKSLANTYESFKVDLIKTDRTLPNPATYVFESEMEVPFQETLLPIAKRSLVRLIG